MNARKLEEWTLIPLKPFGLMVRAWGGTSLEDFSGEALKQFTEMSPLVIFRGFNPLTREEFLKFCESYPGRRLLHWESGPVMEMRPDPAAKNYLFSREAVPFHWDGAFFTPPSFLAFHCLEAPRPSAGGETLFSHTGKIWERATEEERARWSRVELTFETEKLAHYGGRVTTPLVQGHPTSRAAILRFAEPVSTRLNPVRLEARGLDVAAMARRLYEPDVCYAHTWEAGDYVVADNHTLVHGRRAFREDSPRHLRRIQIL